MIRLIERNIIILVATEGSVLVDCPDAGMHLLDVASCSFDVMKPGIMDFRNLRRPGWLRQNKKREYYSLFP